jgi:WD40 repeat protein
LDPYTEELHEYFFGREREQRIISSNLYAAPLTILYGSSGVGKSSILRAGVVPYLLRAKRTAVVYFKRWEDSTFLAALKQECLKAVEAKLGEPLGLDAGLAFPELLTSLAERLDGAIFILLDQFEEYFLYHPQTEFDGEFAAAVNTADSQAAFAVALRDDWLSRLDRFDARIPNLLSNTIRLEHLSTARAGADDMSPAERAIREPLRVYSEKLSPGAPPVTIEDELVQAILREVQAGRLGQSEFGGAGRAKDPHSPDKIETAFLQLVMERLWDKEGISQCQSRTLRLSTFEGLGRAERIVQGHVRSVMTGLSAKEQEMCARMFHYLVTPNFKKIAHETSNLAEWAGVPKECVETALRPVLKKLEEKRVLRRIDPPERYEILHDVLGRGILDWRTAYVKAQGEAEAERKAAEEAARQENEARRQRELAEKAEALAEERQQRLQERARAARRSSLIAGVAIVVALVAVVAFVSARRAQRTAQQEEQVEKAHKLVAAAYSAEGTDPQQSILLALYAGSVLHRLGRPFPREWLEGLNGAVQAFRKPQPVAPKGASDVNTDFSPDGSLVATAGSDGSLEVREVSSRKILMHVQDDGHVVISMAFSLNGKLFATADQYGDTNVWDTSSGKTKWTMPPQPERVRCVAFSRDGQRLATGGGDPAGTVTLWDGSAGRQRFKKPAHEGGVTALAFSYDGSRLATAGGVSGTVKIWNTPSGSLARRPLSGHSGAVFRLEFSPDGKRLVSASGDGTAKVWDLTTGQPLLSLRSDYSQMFSVSFDKSGNRVVTSSRDGRATLWDATTGWRLLSWTGRGGPIQSVAFDAEGERVLTGSWDGTVEAWEVPKVHTRQVMDVAFSPDGKSLASVSQDGTLKLWDAEGEHPVKTLSGGEVLFAVASSRNGLLAASGEDKRVMVWTLSDLNRKPRTWFVGAASGISFSQDGSRLVSASEDGTSAAVWNVVTGEKLMSLPKPKGSSYWDINDVAFSPDDKAVAVASGDSTVRIWDLSSNAVREFKEGHKGRIVWLSFSPDGKQLATCSYDRTAKVWDVKTGRLLQTLAGHTNTVVGVAFGHDGRVATASVDGTARVWDAGTGKELYRFDHPGGVEDVVFSPDRSHRLATAGDDGMVRVFILDNEELMHVAGIRARPWKPEECQEFLHEQACPPELIRPRWIEGGNVAPSRTTSR